MPTPIHDHFFRDSMSIPEVAKDFFAQHLPELLIKDINLETLQLQPGTYIDEKLKKLQSDVLYSIESKEGLVYLYCLVEHQSTPDPLMPFRLHKYMVQIIDQHLANSPGSQLPLVYPLVLYHGELSPYPYSMNIADLFVAPGRLKQLYSEPMKLIDLSQLSDHELLSHPVCGVMEMLQKHIRSRDLVATLRTLLHKGVFERVAWAQYSDYAKVIIRYVMMAADKDQQEEVIDMMEIAIPTTEEQVVSIADRYMYDGYLRGVNQGRQEGRQEGAALGARKTLHKVAAAMLADGQSSEYIAAMTGLPIKEVEALTCQAT